MSFRRTGHSDERRRRVLFEESSPADAQPVKRSRDKAAARAYSDSALADRQIPITALIPTRQWTIWVLFLTALSLVALINLLFAELGRFAGYLDRGSLAALDFTEPGSIANWLAAMMLAWSAVMSAQILNLRRHRVDDYRARYRVWLWMTVLLVLCSMDAVANWHLMIGSGVQRLLGSSASMSPQTCWLMVAGVLLLAVGVRLGFEMWKCRGAIAAMIASIVTYAALMVAMLSVFPLEATLSVHVTTTLSLLANALAWLTTLVYARHVYLDAQGTLTPKIVRERKPKRPKETDDAPERETPSDAAENKPPPEVARIDPSHVAAKQPAAASAAQSPGPLKAAMISAATNKTPVASVATAGGGRKLSKAERKRLRKQGKLDDEEE
jgi:hypothetical protein